MPDRFRLLEEIFARAAGLRPAERAAYLDASCRGDAELRRRVQSLLDQDRDSAVRIAAGIGQAAALAAAEDGGLDEGTRIGAWRIEREIGRGGMGTVYLASRADEQFQRTIALKLVRGAVTPETLRRFLDERRILASLDHPNIARLLDGGATPDGLPYFVMEHVEGLPIDRFCDERTLAVKDRLRLFLQVCDAVQYAHARLVVHRDLKPGNVLVSRDAAVKLLDFGIAKLLAPDPASGEPLQTGVSALRMTPEYASPEQVRGATVTTAADVYSLGVMLYELLSGRRPHEVTGMTPAAIERTLSEDEPIRPSAAAPGPRDAKALTGDLDSIVMKALRKEPEQRYGSVEQLAEDIRRHLDGLPVRARRGTWRYRGLKFVRRNRWALAGAALLLAVVLGSAGALIVQSRRIATERDRAIAAERQALTEAATARQVS
ncbi:MAG TPA: serine/threonine-protein kinase, partial [Candidatus Polarisedimenticolia bacterium]|nr:serine/threonine-protein kinase [Candidatus Polarisedimenticolia bacterium]